MNNTKPVKFYWYANTSSGGTLSLSLGYEGELTRKQKEKLLAQGLKDAYTHMEKGGFIPFYAHLLSSSDIAQEYGNTRQYWEKLLNEGKILYKETSAGRITTDLWVKGYLGKRDEVNKYVRDVRSVLSIVNNSEKRHGKILCPVCNAVQFEYHLNYANANGICRSCGFYVHSSN